MHLLLNQQFLPYFLTCFLFSKVIVRNKFLFGHIFELDCMTTLAVLYKYNKQKV